jgi:hypothetical protein
MARAGALRFTVEVSNSGSSAHSAIGSNDIVGQAQCAGLSYGGIGADSEDEAAERVEKALGPLAVARFDGRRARLG